MPRSCDPDVGPLLTNVSQVAVKGVTGGAHLRAVSIRRCRQDKLNTSTWNTDRLPREAAISEKKENELQRQSGHSCFLLLVEMHIFFFSKRPFLTVDAALWRGAIEKSKTDKSREGLG